MDQKYLELIRMAPTVLRLIGSISEITGVNKSVPKLIDTVAYTLEQVNIPEAVEEMQKLKSLVELMVQETREPTDDEWQVFKSRSDIAHEAIQAVDLD